MEQSLKIFLAWMFHLLNKFKASASQRIPMFHPEEVLIRESQSRRGVVMPQCDLNTTGVITAVPVRPQAARRSVRWGEGRDIKSPENRHLYLTLSSTRGHRQIGI